MKRIVLSSLAFLITSALGHHFAAGRADAAVAELNAALSSSYVWRGQVRNDEPVLQPAVAVGADWNFHFETWLNVDLTDRNDAAGRVSEIDLQVAWLVPVEPTYDLSIGLFAPHFPLEGSALERTVGKDIGGERDTIELITYFAADIPFSPSMEMAWDVDKADGLYLNLGINQDIPIRPERFWLVLGYSMAFATFNYNDFYFGVPDTALSDGNLTFGANCALTKNVTLGAEVIYTWLWDGQIRSAASDIYGYDDIIWGGAVVTVHF